MRRFAYPNVSGKEFIKCGRYRASTQEKEHGEDLAQPHMGNLAQVSRAAHALAPELTRSSAHIYEVRDQPKIRYTGPSMALAYCLALIHGARRVRKPFQELEGDIWCTGAIEPGPYLETVEQNGFNRKLLAFLASANRDRLFLVPTSNLSLVQHWCQNPPRVAEFPEPDKILGFPIVIAKFWSLRHSEGH